MWPTKQQNERNWIDGAKEYNPDNEWHFEQKHEQ